MMGVVDGVCDWLEMIQAHGCSSVRGEGFAWDCFFWTQWS